MPAVQAAIDRVRIAIKMAAMGEMIVALVLLIPVVFVIGVLADLFIAAEDREAKLKEDNRTMDDETTPLPMPPKRFPGDGLPPVEIFPAAIRRGETRALTPEENQVVNEALERAMRKHATQNKPSKLEEFQENAAVIAGGVGASVFGCLIAAGIAGTFLFIVLKVVAAWSKVLN